MRNNTQNITKILFLYKLLREKELSKEEILDEFQKENLFCARSTIINYIDILEKNGIKISIKRQDKKSVYYIKENKSLDFDITKQELAILGDIKKLLISKKDLDYIRKTMRLFFRLSLFIKNEDTKEKLLDFGYYSTLNQGLIEELKRHCQNKDLIMLEYVLPSNENKNISIHADSIKIDSLSNRLYLFGILENGWQFSTLPIDRIYKVKKVIKSKLRFNLRSTITNYTVSQNAYFKSKKDTKEEIIKEQDEMITIQRPVDDDFRILQRLLYFCPDLYNITNDKVKNMVITKLKMMIEYYETKYDI